MSEQRGSLPLSATDPSGATILRGGQSLSGFISPDPATPTIYPPQPPLQPLPQQPVQQPQQPAAAPLTPQPPVGPEHQAFFSQMSPYALRASQALGIDPNVILSQWAWESNYGSSPLAMQHYNLAGITAGHGSPEHGGGYAQYPGLDAFTDAYTNLIWRNFPQAMQTGSDVAAFNQGLVHGRLGSYYDPVRSNYMQGLQQIAATNPYVQPA